MMKEMLASQQNMRSELQSNNEVVQRMQSTQKEQRSGATNMDMMNKQLSQLANSVSEIKGNAGRLPATVHIPEKANVSKVTLRSGTSYKEPEWKESLGESRKTKDKEDILTKRSSQVKTEPVVVPPVDKAPKESLKEATDEPGEKVKGEIPFPYRFVRRRKKENSVDFMSIFGKLEVTMSFLQAMRIPPLGKFINNYIAGKAKKDGEIMIEETASTMVQEELPP